MAASERKLGALPVIRDAFPNTVRLVSTARLRESVLAALVDDDDDLAALAEIEGATSARLVAEERGSVGLPADEMVHGVPHARFINASFAYAKPRQPNRFNGPERGAWYAALSVETCIAEVGFHLTQALTDAGDFNAVVDYAEMHASMSGEFVDLRAALQQSALNADPATGYLAGNALSAVARAAGLNGIVYPSVRHSGGTCVVALWPHVVQSVAQGAVIRLSWNGLPQFEVSNPEPQK